MYSNSHALSNAPQRPPVPADRQQAALHTMVSRWSLLAFNSLTRHDRASFATAFSMRDPVDHIRLAKALKNAEDSNRASSSANPSLDSTISSILATVTGGGNAQVASVLEQFFKFLVVWATDKVTLDRVLEEYALFYRGLLTLFMATTPMGPPIWPLVALIHRQMIAISRQVDYARNVPNKTNSIDSAWNHVFTVLPLDKFPVPLRAPYHAFLGKRAMIVNDDATAESNLTQAIHLTSRKSTRNLRILMCQLIAVRLSAGQPPPQHLLDQYQMGAQWTPVLQAMRRCDFPGVEQAIDQNMVFFRAHGVYGALIERPRAVMMRLCARKCVNVWRDLYAPTDTQGRAPRIHMRYYAAAFDLMFHDEPWTVPADSLNAAYLRVNNLIARGLLRGFVHPTTGNHFVSKFRDINKTVPPLAMPTSAPAPSHNSVPAFAGAAAGGFGGGGGVNGGAANGFGGGFGGNGGFAQNQPVSAFGGFGGQQQQQQQQQPAPFGTVPPGQAVGGVGAFTPPSGFMATMPGFGANGAAPVGGAGGGFPAGVAGQQQQVGFGGGSTNGTGFGFGANAGPASSSGGMWPQVQQPQTQQPPVSGTGFGGFGGFVNSL